MTFEKQDIQERTEQTGIDFEDILLAFDNSQRRMEEIFGIITDAWKDQAGIEFRKAGSLLEDQLRELISQLNPEND